MAQIKKEKKKKKNISIQKGQNQQIKRNTKSTPVNHNIQVKQRSFLKNCKTCGLQILNDTNKILLICITVLHF